MQAIRKESTKKYACFETQFYSTIIVSGSYREASFVVTAFINNDIMYFVCQYITCI